MKKSKLIVVGRFDSNWSVGNVSRGLLQGLAVLNDAYDLTFIDMQYEVVTDNYFNFILGKDYTGVIPEVFKPLEELPCIGEEATILFYGYPVVGVNFMEYFRSLTSAKITALGYFICESSILPETWIDGLNIFDHIFVPSGFVSAALQGSAKGYHEVIPEITVAMHGVHDVFIDTPYVKLEKTDGPPKFLHITGARDFPDRKGTLDLINAMGSLDTGATLTIRTTNLHETHPVVKAAYEVNSREQRERQIVDFDVHTEPMTAEEAYAYYRKGWTALVQPSRAEAFGLCPVEALCCGLPVIATSCTGHGIWTALIGMYSTIHNSIMCVDSFLPGPISVQGIRNGVAPTVHVGSLVAALRDVEHFDVSYDREFIRQFRWERTLGPIVDYLFKKEQSK